MARLEIKLSKSEKKELQDKARSLDVSMSELVRLSVKKARAFSPDNKKAVLAKNRELNRIGNNLNQIARFANTHKAGAEATEIIAHLVAIEGEIKKCL